MKWIKKEQKDHEIIGATPITPFQLEKIRIRLLSSNDVVDLQLYVIILVSIKLFLRSGEATGDVVDPDTEETIYTGLTMESIVPELSIIENGVIECLPAEGKPIKKRTVSTYGGIVKIPDFVLFLICSFIFS